MLLTRSPVVLSFCSNQTEFDGIFNTRNLFVGGNTRKAVNRGQNDYVPSLPLLHSQVPIFFGEVPALMREGRYHMNVCLLHLSPPGTPFLFPLTSR